MSKLLQRITKSKAILNNFNRNNPNYKHLRVNNRVHHGISKLLLKSKFKKKNNKIIKKNKNNNNIIKNNWKNNNKNRVWKKLTCLRYLGFRIWIQLQFSLFYASQCWEYLTRIHFQFRLVLLRRIDRIRRMFKPRR